MHNQQNVLGSDLQLCCQNPITGFFRDGYCRTNEQDLGIHTVCAIVTQEFLTYSKQRGNDLMTARPEFDFPGLKAGDKWCLCASRWLEAEKAGVAPAVVLESTHHRTLDVVDLETLNRYAYREALVH
ncbi:MAG: DUF2237 domain-containing protein [Pseudobacteriovorax sp.]|nr:DUF2237 domain-containing protein [Pseudobacteriovorax sp.]